MQVNNPADCYSVVLTKGHVTDQQGAVSTAVTDRHHLPLHARAAYIHVGTVSISECSGSFGGQPTCAATMEQSHSIRVTIPATCYGDSGTEDAASQAEKRAAPSSYILYVLTMTGPRPPPKRKKGGFQRTHPLYSYQLPIECSTQEWLHREQWDKRKTLSIHF